MKKIFYILLIAIISSACSNDFIDLAPFSQANVENFYKTQEDFEVAVNSIYDVLQDGRLYGNNFEILLEVRSDNGQFNDPASNSGVSFDIDKFQVSSDNPTVKGAYAALYQGVNRANIVLGRIEGIDIEVSIAKRLKGEAKFLRALFYFHLVQLYGNVPLITTELLPSEIDGIKRDEISKIYELIENDLKEASSSLPVNYGNLDKGRTTQGAANGLLAKVYLTEGKINLAKQELEKVINLGRYSLQSSIASVFSPSNEMNDEIIFAVRFKKGEGGEGRSLPFDYTQNPTINKDLINAYDPLDERLVLVQYINVSGSQKVPAKYFDVLSTSNNVGIDIPVLRYSDILLMYAEVLNEEGYVNDNQSLAIQNLNLVRERAGLTPYTTTELVNQITFQAAIYKERRLEFALEFQRWYDLKRTNTAISTFAAIGVNIEECKLIYPIPQDEIDKVNDLANFPQNDCY